MRIVVRRLNLAMHSAIKKYVFVVILTSVLYIFIMFSAKEQTTSGETQSHHKPSMKHILIWTLPDTIPFVSLGTAQETFINRKCPERNCYVTSNRRHFQDIRKFDAVLFHGPELHRQAIKPPLIRSPKQIYVFGSIESSHNYPLCKRQYNKFFNWTWTYRLDSNVVFGYIVVKDKQGEVVGPKEVMHWKTGDQMLPLDSDTRAKLVTKRKAAAWVVSNCNTKSQRETFVKNLDGNLSRYGLVVDVFGGCGKYQCVRHISPDCWDTIKSDYYFYLVFENSFSKDYVTEKLVKALQHYTVPIVYGAANYTRFMPDGSYLNAKDLGPSKLAEEMRDIIQDKERYYNFFRWRNHYSYHYPQDDPATDNFCRLCAALHDQDRHKQTQNKPFMEWWNDSPTKC